MGQASKLFFLVLLVGCFSSKPLSFLDLKGDVCENELSVIDVPPLSTDPSIQTRLLFERDGTLGQYQTIRWKTPPGDALALALEEVLACTENKGRLRGRILDLYVNKDEELILTVDLILDQSRKRFTEKVKIEEPSVENIQIALRAVTSSLQRSFRNWLKEEHNVLD